MAVHRKAILVLNDGTYFEGTGFGATTQVDGEVVFNTGMVGYPESMTDPSYQGQILTLTYPLIGNYGVPDPDARDKWNIPRFFEADFDEYAPTQPTQLHDKHPNPTGIKITGLVIHELCKDPSHWNMKMTLDEWMKREGIPGIEGVDTRELTKKLRVHGVMLGLLKAYKEGEEPNIDILMNKAQKVQDPNERNLVGEVSPKNPIIYENDGPLKIVLIDVGAKLNILRNLLNRKLTVIRVPYDFSAKEILEYKPNGFFITNGPGDPKHESLKETIATTRELVDEGLPLMGICYGNQIFSLAMGADTYKLKYGHRSQNQPSMDIETGRCYITTQNHGFAVDVDSLKQTDLKLWFINVNDKTVEGVKHTKKKAFSVQFHPEHFPGPVDTEYLFEKYIQTLQAGRS
ncbi:MAG TPA: glutamine-hydrolyzing carbamoyl-phosphate synthase small subunit [Candidatus Deferrimicrobium sp.]|nr:glutamine-hydrolyzing carbamoyl-phosphate synthase small subunit [Candidatus Deferrimicrobium sp.]